MMDVVHAVELEDAADDGNVMDAVHKVNVVNGVLLVGMADAANSLLARAEAVEDEVQHHIHGEGDLAS